MLRVALLLLLAGCSYVPVMTAARLAAIDPMTADPGQIELAVVLPPGMNLLPDTAHMTLHIEGGAGQVRDARYRLEESAAPQDVPLPDGAQARAYRLTAADARTMRDLQAEVAGWQGTGPGQASLGVGLDGCKLGGGPAPDAEGAVYVRLAAGGSFLPLLGPARLTDMLGPSAMAGLPPCSAAQ